MFIVLYDRPHTICRTQINNFKSRQRGIIYEDSKVKNKKIPSLTRLIQTCRAGNSPGNCYGLFSKTRKLIRDFKFISLQCRSSLSSLSKVRTNILNIYSLMIQLAWSNIELRDGGNKLNWFQDIDVALFCSLKRNIIRLYGKNILLKLEDKILKKFSKESGVNINQAREQSLLSQNCSLYSY